MDARPNIHCRAGKWYSLMIAVYNVFTIQSHGYLETIPDTALGRQALVRLTGNDAKASRLAACLLSLALLVPPLLPSLVGPTRSSALPRVPTPGFYALERSQLHHRHHLYRCHDHGWYVWSS